MIKGVKKVLSAIMIGVMVGSILIGCGDSSSSSTSGNGGKVTLTFGSHQSGLPTTGIVQDLAKEFEEETGIKVDFQVSPDAQWRDLLKVKLDSGEAPDIFCADADPLNLVTRVNPEKYCLDVTGEEWVSRMDENVIPSVSYKDSVYGITFTGKRMSLYIYNKEIFENLGLEIPTTYNEFKEVCQKIKDSGITPIFEGTQNGWHQVTPLFVTGPMYEANHADLYEKLNKNEMDLDDIPELLTIIKQLKEFADLGFYGDDYLSNSVENAKEAMANGEVAMFLAEPAWIDEVKVDYPDFDISKLGIFTMPWADNQTIGVNLFSNAYFINKNSKNADAALKFFEFLARPENLQKRLDGQPGLSEICWPEIKGNYSEEHQEYINSLEQGIVMQVGVKYIDSQWMDVGKDLESMYIGAMTPEEVVQTIIDRRTEQARLQKDEYWAE